MAEVTIKIIDNDNGNVSFFMEAEPALNNKTKDQLTDAQLVAMAFFEHILNHGIYSFIESANDPVSD